MAIATYNWRKINNIALHTILNLGPDILSIYYNFASTIIESFMKIDNLLTWVHFHFPHPCMTHYWWLILNVLFPRMLSDYWCGISDQFLCLVYPFIHSGVETIGKQSLHTKHIAMVTVHQNRWQNHTLNLKWICRRSCVQFVLLVVNSALHTDVTYRGESVVALLMSITWSTLLDRIMSEINCSATWYHVEIYKPTCSNSHLFTIHGWQMYIDLLRTGAIWTFIKDRNWLWELLTGTCPV